MARSERIARQFQAFVVAVTLLVACSFPSSAHAQSSPGTLTTVDSVTSLHDLFHAFTGLFNNRPFNTEQEITRLVGGDPWEVLPETEAALYTLQPRMRFTLLGLIAENYSHLSQTPLDGSTNSLYDLHPTPWILQFNSVETSRFITPLLNTVLSQFNDVEMFDLAVATVFRLPFTPRTQSQWHSLLHWIDRWDIPIAVAVAAIGALANEGTLQIGGQFRTFRRGAVNLGWYLGTQNLGIRGRPIFRGGLTVMTRVTQIFGGLIAQVNAPGTAETLGAEAYLKQHWIQFFRRPIGWEFICIERANTTILQHDNGGSRFNADVQVYARRPDILGNPNLNFLVGLNTNSDFFSLLQSTVSIGFDEERNNATVVLQTAIEYDIRLAHATYRTGIFAGGSLESMLAVTSRDLTSQARRIRQLLTLVHLSTTRIRLLESERFEAERDQRRTAVSIREESRQLDARRTDLARTLDIYLSTRRAYFNFRGREGAPLTDGDGSLEPELLARARAETEKAP